MRPATDHCLEQNRSVQPSPQSCMIMCALNSLNMLMIDAVDRWPVGYLLERLSDFPEFGERVFCGLLADLLFAPGDGDGSPLRGCELRIHLKRKADCHVWLKMVTSSSEITSVNKSYALRRSSTLSTLRTFSTLPDFHQVFRRLWDSIRLPTRCPHLW